MNAFQYLTTIQKHQHLSVDEKIAAYNSLEIVMAAGPYTAHEQGVNDAVMAWARKADLTWYHGGVAGRAVGDTLLPPRVTGADPRRTGSALGARRDFVFISHRRHWGEHYAQMNNRVGAKSVVYQVEPQGLVDVDPVALRVGLLLNLDKRETITPESFMLHWLACFRCDAAKVTAILGETRQSRRAAESAKRLPHRKP